MIITHINKKKFTKLYKMSLNDIIKILPPHIIEESGTVTNIEGALKYCYGTPVEVGEALKKISDCDFSKPTHWRFINYCIIDIETNKSISLGDLHTLNIPVQTKGNGLKMLYICFLLCKEQFKINQK